jgi:hypothetical protein
MLEMHHMMREIEESTMGGSVNEEAIQDWLDGGQRLPLPFEDRRDIATAQFYERFRELRRRVKGWVHSYNAAGPIVFSPESEWQVIRSTLSARQLEQQKLRKEAQRARWQKDFDEILHLAKSNKAFWQSLIETESALDKNMPARGTSAPNLRIRYRRLPSGRVVLGHERLMEFVSDLYIYEGPSTRRDIAVEILMHLRKSIGSDHTVLLL